MSWKVRICFAGLMLAIASYFLVPSAIYFSLPAKKLREVRKNRQAFEKMIPSWVMSDSHIVPGLDLQGGIHIVLGVDIDKAIADKTSRVADQVRDSLKQKSLAATVTHLEDSYQERIKVHFADNKNKNSIESEISKQFPSLVYITSDNNEITYTLNQNQVKSLRQDAVDQTINTIRSRIDKMGVTEPSIAKRGSDQIQIQLPGYDNPEEAKRLIGRTAQLEFKLVDDETDFLTKIKDLPEGVRLVNNSYRQANGNPTKDIYLTFSANKASEVKNFLKSKVPNNRVIKFGDVRDEQNNKKILRTYTLLKKTALTGDDLVDTRVIPADFQSSVAVGITLSPSGAKIMDKLTSENIGKRLAIILENNVNSAPYLNTRITSGSAQIEMGGAGGPEQRLQEAQQLSLVLKSGSLPAPVTFREERSVGPSLGADSVKAGKFAFLAGGIFIILFMMFYYRFSGLISIIGVTFNILFVLATLSFLGATITLPGLAGLLLTIGMAVDANIIINERIREELKKGKRPREAIELGYGSAFSAVIDANVTTFIAGIVLWQYGTGPVQNFATTLLIGTVSSVITAIFITRIFFDMIASPRKRTLSI